MTSTTAHAIVAKRSAVRRFAGRTLPVLGALAGAGAALIGIGLHAVAVVGPVLGVIGVLVGVADVRDRRIPDRFVVAGAIAAVVVAVTVELVDGRRPGFDMTIGAAAAAVPLLIVHLVAPAGIGFGDVKFAAVIGALLGVISPSLGILAVAAASVAALAGVPLRVWPRWSIPFGACLAAAAVACVALGRWSAT